MKTTTNKVIIPDNANSSSTDTIGNIISSVVNHGNILDSLLSKDSSLTTSQSDYSSGYWVSPDSKFIVQWGYATSINMNSNKDQVIGTITFPMAFPHVCLKVIGSDTRGGSTAGAGMSFGFYNFSTTGCKWCTAIGLGIANAPYAPNWIAIGW